MAATEAVTTEAATAEATHEAAATEAAWRAAEQPSSRAAKRKMTSRVVVQLSTAEHSRAQLRSGASSRDICERQQAELVKRYAVARRPVAAKAMHMSILTAILCRLPLVCGRVHAHEGQWPPGKVLSLTGCVETRLWPAASSSGDMGGPACAGCGSSRQMRELRECATWASPTKGRGRAE